MRAIPNGLDMADWSSAGAKDKSILWVGRGLDDKGHREAMGAIARVAENAPRLERPLHPVALPPTGSRRRSRRSAPPPNGSGGRVRIDPSLPYAEVKAAWEKAAIGMALTDAPSRSAARRWKRSRAARR